MKISCFEINSKGQKKEIEAALSIYKSNPEYFSLMGNEEVSIQSIYKDFAKLPKAIKCSLKLYGLIYIDDEPIAVIDYLIGYPDKESAFLGFLIIDIKKQKKGYGKAIYNYIEEIFIKEEIKKIKLGVLEKNENALAFWKSLGFKHTEDSKNQDGYLVKVFEKSLQ